MKELFVNLLLSLIGQVFLPIFWNIHSLVLVMMDTLNFKQSAKHQTREGTMNKAPSRQENPVKESIENYRKKLLDTSKRNPLISFKHQERSRQQIRVIDELPNVLYEKLDNGKTLQFRRQFLRMSCRKCSRRRRRVKIAAAGAKKKIPPPHRGRRAAGAHPRRPPRARAPHIIPF